MKTWAKIAAYLAIAGKLGEHLFTAMASIREIWQRFKADYPDEEKKANGDTVDVPHEEIKL